jgi:hypothetical protein
VKGGEQGRLVEEVIEVVLLLVQPPKNDEGKGTIWHWLVEVVEGIDHSLHLPTIVIHVQVTLDEGPKHGIKVERRSLVIAEDVFLY